MPFKTFRLNRSLAFTLLPRRWTRRHGTFLRSLQTLQTQRSTVALIVCVLITAILAFATLYRRSNVAAGVAVPETLPLWWLLGLFGVLIVLLGVVYTLWLDYARPMAQLRKWLLAMHAGYLSERLPKTVPDSFACINADLNTLANMLEAQSWHAERQLREHTRHITQKTRSLAALYRIVASINTLQDMHEVSSNVLKTLEDIFDLDGAVIRLRSKNNGMRRTAMTGVIPAAEAVEYLPEDSRFLHDAPQVRRVVIRLEHHGSVLGVCCLYLDEETFSRRAVLTELFISIGYHLSIAVVKARLDARSKRLSIMQDRAWIAHELHDSLAQTISSLRFQTRVLDQAMHAGDRETARQELENLENNIDLANSEVRNLIEHFRDTSSASLRSQNCRSIAQFVRQFRRNHPRIQVFLQQEWSVQDLPPAYENEILRIVQEAFANAHKHSNANLVRLLLRDDGMHHRLVIIEDNGRGMENTATKTTQEKHFGLDMMLECATRIQGELHIETEADEGTRIQLRFPLSPTTRPGHHHE